MSVLSPIITATNFRFKTPNSENHRSRNPKSLPYFSLSKPSWIVRTESNVRREEWKKPDPPCVICKGSGRVDCHQCSGKGRTNHVHLAMLPKGEWPKWCRSCGGSGLGYCSRCVGTGEYRYIMGFHFMEKNIGDTQDQKIPKVPSNLGPYSAANLFLNGEELNSRHGDTYLCPKKIDSMSLGVD